MISNEEGPLKDLSHAIAQGAIRNPIISEYRQEEVQLMDQHAFGNQSIINVQSHPRQTCASIAQEEAQHQRSLDVSQHAQVPRAEQDSFVQGHYHDPLFYGVNPPQPAAIPNSTPIEHQPYFYQRRMNDHASSFRVYQHIPWWLLLTIFLVCLAALGGAITWMFHRGKAVDQVRTVVTNTTITPIPVIKQKTVVQVDQWGNIVEKIETTRMATTIKKHTVPKKAASLPTNTLTPALVPVTPSSQGMVQSKTVQQRKSVVQVPRAVTPINQPKGLICSEGSFSFNNRCYSCPKDQRWNGSNCISVLHLRRP